jgi:Lrp/AsnC family leucine-responsive transcriptional regulator
MDAIDYRIVRALQDNARLTLQELSERVSLSPSPCLRRLRRLEKEGVIRGYTALVDQERYGLPVTVFVEVRLEHQTDASIRAFEAGLQGLDEVVSCYLMAGSRDYLLQVVTHSLKTYERFIRDKLTRIPGIGSLESHFAFGQVKQRPVLPEMSLFEGD